MTEAETDAQAGAETAGQELRITLDWVGADDVQPVAVNVIELQAMGRDLILNLGLAAPPFGFRNQSPAETEAYLRDTPLVVRSISRFLLPPETARVLATAILQLLKNHEHEGRILEEER